MSDEVRTTSATGGQKGVKPERFDLIPVAELEEVARLYAFGATKYDDHNWAKGYNWSNSYAALQRHANAFWRGEETDAESGLSHMASVVFHALTLMYFARHHRGYDDRHIPPLVSPGGVIANPNEVRVVEEHVHYRVENLDEAIAKANFPNLSDRPYPQL